MNGPLHFPAPHENFSIAQARVVTPDGIVEQGLVRIESGIITEVRESQRHSSGPDTIDGGNCLLLPGLVDIHADSLEMAIAPRPAAPFDIETVLPTYDATLAMYGITTVFHCVGLADLGNLSKPLRTRDKATEIVDAVKTFSAQAQLRTFIHLRYEIPDTESLPLLHQMIEKGLVDLVSIMDHTPGFGVFKDVDAYRDYYLRSGQEVHELDGKIEQLLELRSRVDQEALKALIASCLQRGMTVVSHDDHTAEKLSWARALGVKVAEFPVTMEAIQYARQFGMQTVYGTPNLIRGKSHAGNLRVADLLLSDLVDILCLDYSPMCSLLALFKAVQLTGKPIAEVSRMFSLNPARAVNLDHLIGSIEPGKAADLILVDTSYAVPRVISTFAGGRPIYQSHQSRTLVS